MSQLAILEAISNLKKKKRQLEDDGSESDHSIHTQTNRGNKLKRKAKYVTEGHLNQANGPRVYKRKLTYNGYTRHIISRNPPRVDQDGDVVEEDDDESNPELEPAEEDPYANVSITNTLMPLTSAADLDKHPSLSVPYRSRTLNEMVQRAQEMVHREHATLWRLKGLAAQFRGDEPWAPCGIFETDHDPLVLRGFDEDFFFAATTPSASVDTDAAMRQDSTANWDTLSNVRLMAGLENATDGRNGEVPTNGEVDHLEKDTEHDAYQTPELSETVKFKERKNHAKHMQILDQGVQLQAEHNTSPRQEQTNGIGKDPASNTNETAPPTLNVTRPEAKNPSNGVLAPDKPPNVPIDSDHASTIEALDISEPHPQDQPRINGSPKSTKQESPEAETDAPAPAHRMTTRARAQASNPCTAETDIATTLDAQADDASVPPIHPFFLPSPQSLPDPDCGLPPGLASDTRRLLFQYTQKQEEVVRQGEELLEGLRKALRLRKTVWSWCRAEAHVGEMSDGEDWIDEEEWGLEGPLKKGEEVEDEEMWPVGGQGTGKKTRNRRAAG